MLVRVVRRYPFPCLVTLVLVLIGAGSGLADFIAPYDPNAINPTDRLQGPNSTYWMGTDALGRDVFTRVLYGGRASLGVSVTSVALGVVVATAVGLVSGALSGWFDVLVQRIVDMLMAFPGLIIVISLTAFFGTSVSLLVVVIAIALLGGGIRISRAAAIQVSSQPYIEAARTIGATTPRIIVRHILPNALPPIMVIATAYLGVAILIEASVSFLGYGIQPPRGVVGVHARGRGADSHDRAALALGLAGPGDLPDRVLLQHHRRRARDAFDPRLRGSG